MKSNFMHFVRLSMVALFVVIAGSVASAQVNSNIQTVTLTATLNESLTVGLSGNVVTFSMNPGAANNAGNTTITATTSWALNAGRNTVRLYAYFANAASALNNGAGSNIPSSAFKIQVGGAGAFNALTNANPFNGANAGLQLFTQAITAANRVSNRSDSLAFTIDLSGGTLPTLPVGGYNGTLNIQAQATP
jgi:hypothetical protein